MTLKILKRTKSQSIKAIIKISSTNKMSTSTATTTNKQNNYVVSRERYVATLTEAIHYEKKGDYLEKHGQYDLATRAYTTGLQLEEKMLGKSHPLVFQLREKLLVKRGSLQKTFQRKDMKALEDSFKHEKHVNYLMKAGQMTSAVREYKYCLKIEKRVIGKNHHMVSQLSVSFATILQSGKFPKQRNQTVQRQSDDEQLLRVIVPLFV